MADETAGVAGAAAPTEEQKRATVEPGGRAELAESFFVLRAAKVEAEAKLESIKTTLVEIETQLVVRMENEGLQSFKDAENGIVYLREQVYARIADEAMAFEWLRAHDMGDIIKEKVHARTLASIVKDHAEIPGVVASYETKIGHRKG